MMKMREVTGVSVEGSMHLPQAWGWSTGNRSMTPDLVEVDCGCQFRLKDVASAISNSDGVITEKSFTPKRSFRKSLAPLEGFQPPPSNGETHWLTVDCECCHWQIFD